MKNTMYTILLFGFLSCSTVCLHGDAAEVYMLTHKSSALQKETSLNIILPNGLKQDERYPVLYLLHGAYGCYRDWAERTDIETYADGYEMIIVMPDGGQFGWYVDSPLEATSAYETYITKDLIEAVDRLLPTIASRDARGICGLSMGGHGAMSLAAKHPDLFSSASSLSGILRISAHPEKWHIAARLGSFETASAHWIANSVYDLAQRFLDTDVQLLFDCGVDDTGTGAIQDARDCHERFNELGVQHIYNENPGAHSWQYWDDHIQEHLDFHADNFEKRLGMFVSKRKKIELESNDKWLFLYRDRMAHFRAENQRLKRLFPERKTVVLLGSSTFVAFNEAELLPGWLVLDRGISGDGLGVGDRGILHRLQESVFDCNPAHIF
ncbi:MAG TPA: alpha/beta hydrolase-fold protein, partial [bacterium]|nr:alpha/beta hydrolase-fold protein [bacterium]